MNTKKIFRTYYRQKSGLDSFKYSSYVYAYDQRHADNLLELRGIGEWIADCKPLEVDLKSYPDKVDAIKLFNKGLYVECAHAVTFILYVLSASKPELLREAVADKGVLHELLHLATDTTENSSVKEKVSLLVNRLQWRFDHISH